MIIIIIIIVTKAMIKTIITFITGISTVTQSISSFSLFQSKANYIIFSNSCACFILETCVSDKMYRFPFASPYLSM